MATISGVITAMVTPFDEGGRLDADAARRLAGHLGENGSHGLVIAGTTGESPTLSDAEKLDLLRAVKDEVGDELMLIFGSGSNDTHHSVELTRAGAEAGANAFLVVTPYYNKPNHAGLLGHFGAVAEAAGSLPVVVYNIPSRCVVNIDPELLAELGRIDNVAAVKQANNDDLGPIDGLDVLAGNDEIFLSCLEIGGTGGILVASNLVGREMREVYDAATGGDMDRARELDSALHEIYKAMTVTTNPIPVKAGVEMLGLIGGRMRLPMVEADEEQRAVVRAALERQGLLAASPG
ncbi:MAG TPA: 4-hydroxy-tetrahydrodipicolinate synthase [Solirubrobacterales bacterium]|jgi:4-hydroxy-tetrahydrodipicolinate synthase|nr:4-hydroxy-tetrahydrodipicolinate synthase [Solirubrobacterales bacterium]